jgi:ATP-dependent RNA helicase RhlE
MICVPRDEKNLADVERLVQKEIPRLDNPLGETAAAPAPAAEDAPREDKPKRTRSRGGRKPKDDAQPAPVAAEAPVEQTAEAPKPRRDRKPREDKGSKPQNQSRRNDNKVVGLGDDVPSFLGQSFAERKSG